MFVYSIISGKHFAVCHDVSRKGWVDRGHVTALICGLPKRTHLVENIRFVGVILNDCHEKYKKLTKVKKPTSKIIIF